MGLSPLRLSPSLSWIKWPLHGRTPELRFASPIVGFPGAGKCGLLSVTVEPAPDEPHGFANPRRNTWSEAAPAPAGDALVGANASNHGSPRNRGTGHSQFSRRKRKAGHHQQVKLARAVNSHMFSSRDTHAPGTDSGESRDDPLHACRPRIDSMKPIGSTLAALLLAVLAAAGSARAEFPLAASPSTE